VTEPHRRLILPGALAAAAFVLLLARAATVTAGESRGPAHARIVAAADTDTVVVARPDLPAAPDSLLFLDSLAAPESLVTPDSALRGVLPIPLPPADSAIRRDSLARADDKPPDAVPGDTVASDTVRADTVRSDSLARLYFPDPPAGAPTADIVEPTRRPFGLERGPYWRREVQLDSTELSFEARETVAGQDVRVPIGVDIETYRAARLRQAVEAGFRDLAAQRTRAGRPGRTGFGVTIDIPGGSTSPFRTLFGRNEVDLRVNGQATIDVGVNYQQNEVQQAYTGQGGVLNPDFGQELRLGITGTIGDKLRVNVNYDTQNQFDFENQVSLVYTGYDDDIVQRIEAGNVFLQSPSELIRGGQRLFGLRSDLRFGPVSVTAVASQQDAESSELVLEGGSQTTNFALAPYDYEDNAHFYLGYRFHAWWDEGHVSPNTRTPPPGFDRITSLEVWRFDPSPITEGGQTEERTQALALADLAEPGPNPGDQAPPAGTPLRGVLAGAERYLEALGPDAPPLPDTTLDQYDTDELRLLRDSTAEADYEGTFSLRPREWASGPFRLLREGTDYTYDPRFGTISLKRPLTERERLGVAYQYATSSGQTVQVGDFNQRSQTGGTRGNRIILKLLRAAYPTTTDAAWGLTMRNVYRIGGRRLTAADFDLDVFFEPSGSTPQLTLPGVVVGQQATLMQMLGLDRLNRDGAAEPDASFDFVAGYTVDADEGRVIFPFREPFGERLRDVLNGEAGFDVTFQGISQSAALAAYAFDTLYAMKQDQARQRFPALANYRISGTYRSAVQSTFDLGFGVVPGSVRVTAGGVPLTEGVDYQINAATGQLEIVNRNYLTTGANLRVEYERNQFASIGSKTLLGLRAEYALSERVGVGATWMRLAERPLVDKYRVGEEPISNAIYGFDARYEAEPGWITRLVDALPLLTTRATSRFEFKGEFAQLLPGHPETFAFDRASDLLEAAGRSFSEDERGGVSYIDDFEGAENTLTLMSPGEWRISATPDPDSAGVGPGPPGALAWRPGVAVTDPMITSNWRGLFAWYAILNAVYDGPLCQQAGCTTPAVAPVRVRDIFPDRERRRGESEFLTTLDLYFDPSQRGPYNVNRELQTTYAADPQEAWGGIHQRLGEGYTDFTGRNNIEFLEFIFSPMGGRDGAEAIDAGAVLYVDLGSVSEDVVPNGLLNSEDGLLELPATVENSDPWGRLPTGQAFNTVDLDEATNRTEDLGLDGLPSRRENPNGQAYEASERDDEFFGPFVDALTPGTTARALAELDPAADDFHNYEDFAFFDNPEFYPQGATVQERFSRFFPNPEFNSFEAQRRLTMSGEEGVARLPDTEDLDGSTDLDDIESHFRYEIPLDSASLAASPYFQGRIPTQDGRAWYLVRLPVRSDLRASIGGIQDFSLIEAVRLWTTGHTRPATMRFATLELVGSQWLKSERVGIEDRPEGIPAPATEPRSFVETINNEESPTRYAIPLGAIVSFTRDIAGAIYDNREQSIILRVEDLPDGEARAIYRPFSTPRLDLSKYTNIRLFTHGEGFLRRDSVRVMVRLGSNETTDYYEIEQPLYPFEPDGVARPNADSLWQTAVRLSDGQTIDLNSINLPLGLLNQLKAERDGDPDIPRDEPYQARGLDLSALPPEAVLRIRGNPSLRTVSAVVMGLRNAPGGDAVLDDVEVWFNELRVSGYEEEGGWSAYARTSLRLADFADVNFRFSRQTEGFGELGAGLGSRVFADQQAISLLANVNLHRFLPERFGWSAPLAVSLQNTLTSPRFDPRRGDIRVSELVAQAESDPRLSEAARDSAITTLREEAQTALDSRSIRVQLSKTGSRSPWLRYSLDGVTLVYSTSQERQRSPSQAFNDRDTWSGSASYRLTVPRARTVRPFWFLDDVPVLSVLQGLRFNYLPQSFRITAGANRSMTRDAERVSLAARADSSIREVPLRFLTPVRRGHQFRHDRNIELQYTPLTFLALGYRSDVDQSLSTAGSDISFTVYARAADGFEQTFEGLTRDQAFLDPAGPGRPAFGIPDTVDTRGELATYLAAQGILVYEVRDLSVRPLGQVLSDLFSGERDIITDRYSQAFTASLQPTFDRIRALSWFRPQALSFASQFTYDFQPLSAASDSADTGAAGVVTQLTLRGGLTLRPRELWRLFPFYRRLEEGQRAGGPTRPTEARPAAPATPADSAGAPPPPPPTNPRRGFNPLNIGRQLFLALTGLEDVTVTYNGTQSSAAGGLRAGGYNFIDALYGYGPSLGFRLGTDRRIPIEDRLNSDRLQFQDNLTDNHRFDARTQIRLSNDLNVNLTWQVNWNAGETFSFVPGPGGLDPRPGTLNGASEATVLALGGTYDRLLQSQLARLERDRALSPDSTGRIASGVLSTAGVTDDFRSAFARGLGSFGPSALFALPMPNWDVTYSGLGRWPLLRALTQQVQLRHGYSATYRVGYQSDALGGQLTPVDFNVPGGTPLRFYFSRPDLSPTTVTVNERFQPLIGLNVTWKGGIQTELAWNRSQNVALAAAAARVDESETEEASLRVSYARSGLQLPFLRRRRLNNNLRFTLTLSRTSTNDQALLLRQDLLSVLAGTEFQRQATGVIRLAAEPRLSYTISNQVSVDLFLRYAATEGRNSQIPSSSQMDGGVSFRVSFSN